MKKQNIRRRYRLLITAAAMLILIAAGMLLHSVRAHHVAPLRQETLRALDLSHTDKLMIVAHPDDEIIWGGGHLLDGGYLVLCITDGRSKTRAAEFRKAVSQTGNIPLILEYPDKVNFRRDNWKQVRQGILSDLQNVIALKQWSLIVTHNPDGEYGHTHHKMTNALTVQAYEALNCASPLFFFGRYYKASVLPDYKADLQRLPADILRRKREICLCYASQSDVIEALGHMLPYENWTPYQKNP